MLQRVAKRFFSSSPAAQEFRKILQKNLEEIHQAGTYKKERIIASEQQVEINSANKNVLNFCSNNYLGLANNKEIREAAKKTLDERGYGLSSVRFICGTQDLHKKLESTITAYHGTEDTILYPSCFDANAGFFEALLTPEDAVISDALNHASIIDGIRLCKAQRHRYEHLDMANLERILKETQKNRVRMIVTDGVFSMDGDIAPLDKIVELAKKYKALIFVDESHASGFMGPTGKGTPEIFGVHKEIDVINSTMGKALGGASGGYTTGNKEIVDMLRQRSRPYLFSNSVAPPIIGASLKVYDLLKNKPQLRESLKHNTKLFRERMKKAGFKVLGHDESPIAPVWLGDARLASEMADDLLKENIYVIGFSYPVVPKGAARIRVQLSAAHTPEHVNKAVDAFIKVGKARKIIS